MAVNKIQKFIKANGLDFTGSGSELNGNCVSLAGYALHLDLTYAELVKLMTKIQVEHVNYELERVFDYAYDHNYGAWWSTDDAKDQYKF